MQDPAGGDLESTFREVISLILRARAAQFLEPDITLPDALAGPLSALELPRLQPVFGSPHDVLTRTYEALLDYRPCMVGGRFALGRSPARRRRHGAFYTPALVARRLTRSALAATPGCYPSILDPSMGTGAFLFAALHELTCRGVSPAEAACCLRGVDQDPIAVWAARVSLWLVTGADPELLARQLICSDVLRSILSPADVVLGNPPWGVRMGRLDSFKRFTALSGDLARHTLALVLPQAVLQQSTHRDVRARLLSRLHPVAVYELGNDWFPAAAPACALVFSAGPAVGQIAAARLRPSVPVRHHLISRARWSECGFPFGHAAGLDLLERLRRAHPALGDLPHLLRVHDTGINYGRAFIARQALYRAGHPADPRDLPRFRGRNFHRYTSISRDGWIRYQWDTLEMTGHQLSYDRSLRLRKDKIVIRQTADRIIATLDFSGMVMGRSVIAITAHTAVLRPLLACLNSRLMVQLYRALAGEEGRVLPQVKVARLQALPLPSAFLQPRSADLRCLASLCDAMLAAQGRDQRLDEAIEQQVCNLYGLGLQTARSEPPDAVDGVPWYGHESCPHETE